MFFTKKIRNYRFCLLKTLYIFSPIFFIKSRKISSDNFMHTKQTFEQNFGK